jgi:APA family basic amino acid/polyamine antiporter
LNGWILIQGQIPFAAARDGLFPKPFADVDERGTPRTGLVIGSVLASLLVCTNYNGSLVSVFTSAALLATAACLLPYLLTAAAFWKLDARFADRAAWRKPVALLGLIYSVWALIGTGSEVLMWGAGLLLAGLPVYFFMRRGARAAATQASP